MSPKDGPRRVNHVRQRARQIMQRAECSYGRAMRKAGWITARAANDPKKRRTGK